MSTTPTKRTNTLAGTRYEALLADSLAESSSSTHVDANTKTPLERRLNPTDEENALNSPSRLNGAAAEGSSLLTHNKQLYVDLGTQLKTFLRAFTIGIALAMALQQLTNGFKNNTHFRSIYATCLFVAGCQTILAICVGCRHLIGRSVLFMIELFLDFFSFAIASLIGAIATARCESDSPVKPCYHAIMKAPLIGCAFVGSMCFLIFFLTLLRK